MKRNELGKSLKTVLIIAVLVSLVLLFVVIPLAGKTLSEENPEFKKIFVPCLIFVYISAVPVFIAYYKFWVIFSEIARDNSFSDKNAKLLREISMLAVIDSVLYFLALILLLIFYVPHTVIIVFVLFVIFVGLILSVLCTALSHLVKKAAALKQENDLTI